MAKNINSLLSKKGWTGEDVGKALVASLVHDIKHQREPDYKPLFSQSDFERMESSLNTDRDYLIYGIYRDIYSGLIEAYNNGQGLYQQFFNGYQQYVVKLKDANIADYLLTQAELIPYVMTEGEYNSLKERTEATLKSFEKSYAGLMFHILDAFVESPEDAPEAIRDAIEATKEEAVTNKSILSEYNEAYGLGYYQLPDGTRSDQTTNEEWEERLRAEYVKNHQMYREGELASWEDIALTNGTDKREKAYFHFFNGADGIKAFYEKNTGKELSQDSAEELLKACEKYIVYGYPDRMTEAKNGTVPRFSDLDTIEEFIEGELDTIAEWHYYTEAPANLTKYDVIEDSYFYRGWNTEDGEPRLKEFKADYPALYKALEAYIKEIVPQAKSLKPSQYNKDFISWGELAELGIQKYIKLTTANNQDIAEQIAREGDGTIENYLKWRRIARSGIAISKEPSAYCLNESGEFIDKMQNVLAVPNRYSIDGIDEIQKAEIVAFQEKLFKPALRYLYAFNALVKIISDIYDLDEMASVELKTTHLEERLDAFNGMLYSFYANVYGDTEEKDRKRKLIKDIFRPVDYGELKPTQEAIDAVTAEIDKLGFSSKAINKLRKFDSFIDKLSERGE